MRQALNFESVPVEVALRAAGQERLFSLPTPACPICQKPVELELCKVDEHGRGVHTDCYVAQLSSGSQNAQRT